MQTLQTMTALKPAKFKIVGRVAPPEVARATAKQAECNRYHAAGSFLHFMNYGGARSAKTFRNVRLVVARAMLAPGSRHVIVRATQKSVRSSIMSDTLPKVMSLCYPTLLYKLNKTTGVMYLPNGSEIWLAGLDNSRIEKILGQEFATIFFNEVSELAYTTVLLVWTRLAQKVPLANNPAKHLKLMMLYDCNPPKKKHWSYKLFIDKIDPLTDKPLANPEAFGCFQMNPADNPHLPEETKRILQSLPPEQRKRFWEGLFGDAVENALWTWADFRPFPKRELMPDFRRIVVAVDPPGGDGSNPATAEAGIVVAGLGTDGCGYVLRDMSLAGRTETWAKAAVNAYNLFGADAIVGEINFGGDMVRAAVHAVDETVNFKPVRASRGKAKRAEPVAALYGQKRVFHAPRLDALENQMCDFTADFDVKLMGYSPDRVDALVWGLTDLMLVKTHGMGSMGHTGT